MPFLRTKRELIYYHQARETGRADRTVVLLHGAGGTGRRWNAQLAGIDGHRLIAPDLPGHGQSEGEARGSVAEYLEFVSDFVSGLGLKRFVIGGHSLGGAIALDFALTHHDLMDGLILVGSGGRLRVKPEILETLARGELPVGNVQYSYALNASTDVLDRAAREMKGVPAGVYLADFRACDTFDALDRLGGIRVPTLVICGKDDRMTPVKFSEYLIGHIPNAKLALVPDAGHMVMIEQPRVVNEHIAAFLDALRG
jgi:pimeloyl-ACP methyl ester carboxylesterase